jgi:hypothetical protein
MQLVKSRPIPLPVFKSGYWYDDFAVTGASDPMYTLTGGAKDKFSYGIRLRATTGTYCQLYLPILPGWYLKRNFEAEAITRLVEGSILNIVFRFLDGNNRNIVRLTSGNQILLIKGVSGVYTTLATTSGVTTSLFKRIGIRAIGSDIKVFLDGTQIISVNEPDNAGYGGFNFDIYDGTTGLVKADFQYLAINPL